jgi:outer membrane receptor for ferrienterochelin and colicins
MLLRYCRRRIPGAAGLRVAAGGRRAPWSVVSVITLLAGTGVVTSPLAAQAGTGTVAGKVTAAGDTAIVGATVLVDGTLLNAVTNSRGIYRIGGLPPGRHTLRVAAMGYAAAARKDVEVTADRTVEVDFSLTTSPFALPGVIVTASRETQQITESPASVSVITRKDLTQRDVTQLNQALPYAAGVTYQGGTLDIRGAAGLSGGVGSRVLLMLDGHPLITGDTGELDFDILPVLGVSRIEIVKGPYSALYGSNALGGVVNVVPSPIPDQSHTIFRTHAGAYDIPSQYQFTNSLLHYQGVEMQHSMHLGDVGVRVYGDRDETDGFTQNGHTSRWLFRLETSAPLFGSAPSSFYAIAAQEDIGENFGWRSAQQRFEVPADAVGDWYRMGWLDFGATLNALTRASTLLRFSPYLYYDAVRNHFHDNRDYHRGARGGSSVQLTLQRGSQSLTLGADAAYSTVWSSVIGTPKLRDYALFAQDVIQPSQRIRASVGVRFDDHSVTPGKVNDQLSPKLGIVYHVSPNVSLRGSLSRAFRAPSPVEQFVSTTQYGVLVVPNPDLQPETVTAGEVGATADLGRLWLDGAVFQSRFNGLIQPGPVPGRIFVFQFQNVARARVTGVDLEARFEMVPRWLGLDATYMYLDPWDLTLNEPLPYRSAHTATGTLTVLGGLVNLDLQYRSRVERVLQYPNDPRGSTTLVGLRMAYQVGDLLLQGKVSNLFQESYVDLQERFPGAPRSFTLTLSRGLTSP